MPVKRIPVLVLYRRALFGQGLRSLLQDTDNLDVLATSLDCPEQIAGGLAWHPRVIVLEEGGPIGVGEILDQTDCPSLIAVSLDHVEVSLVRRDTIKAPPEELARVVRALGVRRAGRISAVPVGPGGKPAPATEGERPAKVLPALSAG